MTRVEQQAYRYEKCTSPGRTKSIGTVSTTFSSSLGSTSRASTSSSYTEPSPESLAPRTSRVYNGKSPSPIKTKRSGSGSGVAALAVSPSPTSPAPNLLMVKILAKEVAASLIREGMRRERGGNDALKHSSHSFDSTDGRCQYPSLESLSIYEESNDEEDDLVDIQRFASGEFDVESVVELVLENVKKEQQKSSPGRRHLDNNPDRELRTMLRENLQDDLLEEESQPLTPRASSRSGSMKTSGSGSSTNRAKARSRSNHSATSSKISGVSFVSGGAAAKQPQMDIWHPDFWSVEVDTSEAAHSKKCPPSAAITTRPGGRTFQDPIEFDENEDEPSFQGEEEEDNILEDADDDCSVISKISGLTDAWNFDRGSSSSSSPPPDMKRTQDHSRAEPSTPGTSRLFSKPLIPSPLRSSHKMVPASPGTVLPEANSSLIGSHVVADARSVASRRSKSSLSSGGSKNKPGSSSRSSIRTKGSTASSFRQQRSCAGAGAGLTPRTVTFTTVSVRHYERILCDNPAASSGLAVGIGWRFAEEDAPVCVEEWQTTRRRGRSQSELQLSRSERDQLVKTLGYTDREIAAFRRELNRCRANRRQTVNNLGAQRVEETVESVKTKVKSMLFLV